MFQMGWIRKAKPTLRLQSRSRQLQHGSVRQKVSAGKVWWLDQQTRHCTPSRGPARFEQLPDYFRCTTVLKHSSTIPKICFGSLWEHWRRFLVFHWKFVSYQRNSHMFTEVADEIRMLASDPEAYKLKMEEKRRIKDNRGGRHRFVLFLWCQIFSDQTALTDLKYFRDHP